MTTTPEFAIPVHPDGPPVCGEARDAVDASQIKITGVQPLPDASQLAALGSVLCLYRADTTAQTQMQADLCAVVRARVDALGAREWVGFRDTSPAAMCIGSGACENDRLRLYLLPDTDFLAWERMTVRLAQASESASAHLHARHSCRQHPHTLHARLLARMRSRLHASRWRALALRLCSGDHITPDQLTALPMTLSALGRRVAEVIVRSEGAEWALPPQSTSCSSSFHTHTDPPR